MSASQQRRWIAGFAAKGNPDWLTPATVKLLAQLAELRWITQAPPGTPAWHCGWRYYREGGVEFDEDTKDRQASFKANISWSTRRYRSREPPSPSDNLAS